MGEAAAEARIAELEAQLEHHRRLAAASYALHQSLDVGQVLQSILGEAAQGVGAERGTVFLFTEDRSELWSEVVSGSEPIQIRLPVGQGIAGCVAATGETIRIDDAYADPRFDSSWDERSGFRTRSILCAPIRSREGEVVGCFQLLNKRGGGFDAADEEFLAGLSIHAALAVENARLHEHSLERERQAREIDLALEVQRWMQPERREAVRGRIVAAGFNELCEDASGDYYDFLPDLPGGRLGVAIGDVSGHGLQAALLMTEARAFLRALTATTSDAARVVELLNDHLVPDLDGGRFVSLFVALIEPASGRVEWCNAGHCPPLHFRGAGGAVRELTATGPILGIQAGLDYEAGEPFLLAPGDSLFLFTDGATEARDAAGELLGDERLRATFAAHASESPAALLEAVIAEVRRWTGGARNEDDLTLVALRHVPRP